MNRVALAQACWHLVHHWDHRLFRKSLENPARIQEGILHRYLHENATTSFGRQHHFSKIRSVEEFQQSVPLSTYDDYFPWIDRITAGETSVLTASPVRRFLTSSGSTQAAKLLPWTGPLGAEFLRAIAPWMCDLYGTWPEISGGPAYWSVTPVLSGSVNPLAGQIPVGFEEDTAYLGGFWKNIVERTLAVPSSVARLTDPEDFRYATALFLLGCRDLRFVSIWHPSFLLLLGEAIKRHWNNLLRDIDYGTLTWPSGKSGADHTVFSARKPDPKRSRELCALRPEEWGTFWPRLQCISAWGDGHASVYLEKLHSTFPHQVIQPKGLIATEAIVSIPFQGRHPVAVRSHFFEFLGVDGRAYGVNQLKLGSEYSVVVTTGGGLYRYRLQDRVLVDGFVSKTPSLRFLGKEDSVVDFCGEKLSEGFVSFVLERLFKSWNLRPTFALVAPQRNGDVVNYCLFIESPTSLPPTAVMDFQEGLSQNPAYRSCAALGQLGEAKVFVIHRKGYESYVQYLQKRGQRLGTIKAVSLSANLEWSDQFDGCVLR